MRGIPHDSWGIGSVRKLSVYFSAIFYAHAPFTAGLQTSCLFFFFKFKKSNENKTQNTKYKGKLKAVGLYINDVCMVSDRKQKHDKNTNRI